VSVRVTVDLPGPAVEVLRELAEKRSTTMTEVLRHAISLEQQVDQELSQEAKMLIQKKDGSLEELVVFP
jgi:predicted transcriptional regulator